MTDPKHFRQEIIRLDNSLVNIVSLNADNATSIPIPSGYYMSDVEKVVSVLNDTSWEAVSVDKDYVWFKRYVEGKYPGT